MHRKLLAFSVLIASASLHAQQLSELKNLQPRSIGPAAMSGRVTSIAVATNHPNTMYIGTASGGAWKSENGGLAWTPVFDKMDVASIGSVAIQQSNTDVVWVGTGEGNPRNSHNSGKGIYKSLDAGKTWKKMGLENTKTIHRVLIDPSNANTVYAAAMGSAWGPGADRGVYKTTDGGQTWEKILFVSDKTGCAELVMDPNNPNKLFAAMWEYERKPYTFNSGGRGSGLYMTTDGGKNWKRISATDGLPDGILGRIGIAIAPSKTNVVYAIVESKKLEMYRSEDGGYKWKKVSESTTMGNRPFYYNEIYVDPKNENRVFSLWSQVSKSEDGGKSWSAFLDWGHIHPDHHAFYIHPNNSNLMLDGNDGGLNISQDGGYSWRYVANLPIGQFYHVRVDNETPYNVYGGLQDNGSYKGPGYTWNEGGIRNSDWQELLFGDGFDVIPLIGDASRGYATYQGGNIYFYDQKTHASQAIKPIHPDGLNLRFNWNAGMAPHPTILNGIYVGSQFLHFSRDNGKSWKIISPDLTTNDTSKLHQDKSGGLTIDATNAENYCTILAIAPATSDTNVIWIGTDDGNVQFTKNGGKTWSKVNPTGLPKNAWIPYIYVSDINPGEAWVVANNYRQNDWEPYLYKTVDYGKTWKSMVDGKKVNGHCLSVFPDKKTQDLVFLGTDCGLWISLNGGVTWEQWKDGMPSCPVQDFAWQSQDDDLVIGTFGRSIYVLDNVEALRKLATGFNHNLKIKVLQSENATTARYSRPSGERYGADGFFLGANKSGGAHFCLYTAGTKNEKTGKWEKTKINVKITDASGKIFRSEKIEFDSAGIYSYDWHLHTDGFRFPSHHSAKKDADLPPGLVAPPGKYRVTFSVGAQSETAEISILENELQPFSLQDYNVSVQMMQELKAICDRAYNAFEALKTSENTISKIREMEFENDSAAPQLLALSKPVLDSIKALKLIFMLPSDAHYYNDATPFLNEYLQNAYGFIANNLPPKGNAISAISVAKMETDKALLRINTFYENQWKSFKTAVEKEKVKIITTPDKF